MLSSLLITLDILVCIALVAVVLLQRSEGGGFVGGGGNPSSLMTVRGAGDLLTRTTWILFALFLAISLSLTLLGARERTSHSALQSLKLAPATNSAIPLTAPGPVNVPLAPSPSSSPFAPPMPSAPTTRRPATPAPAEPILEAPAPKPAPTGQH